jgi:hypothetical protein
MLVFRARFTGSPGANRRGKLDEGNQIWFRRDARLKMTATDLKMLGSAHWGHVAEQRRSRFRYGPESRQAILSAIPLSEGETATSIVAMCERVATHHITIVELYVGYPTRRLAERRIESILQRMSELIDLVEFDPGSDVANLFWQDIFSGPSATVSYERLSKFARLARSFTAAHHLLRRFSERDGLQKTWLQGTSVAAFETRFLQQLACVYYHILHRKPGRSKSTVGPFVRFAWAAMTPVLQKRMPTIDALNDKWARLRYDATKTKVGMTVGEFEEFFS